MLNLRDEEAVLEQLAESALLLTPNHQLAVAILETYGTLRRNHGLPLVCPSPAVHAVDQWLRDQWQALRWRPECDYDLRLLEAHQEQLLWRETIVNSQAGQQLLNPDATVRAASEAHALMLQHDLPLEELETWLHDTWQIDDAQLDIGHFVEWHRRFDERLATLGYQTLSQSIERIIPAIEAGHITLPGRLLTFAFSEPPPLYRRLLDAMQTQASLTSVSLQSGTRPVTEIQACESSLQEVVAAARWVSETLHNNGEARIGILCPDLAQRETALERVFSQYLRPQDFSLSTTRNLDAHPLIAAALGLLSLNEHSLDTLEICRLLHLHCLPAYTEELPARAALERRLRHDGERRMSPATLRTLCHRERSAYYCPTLGAALQSFAEAARPLARQSRPAGEWLPLIRHQLASLGWPGAGPFSEGESQALAGWQNLLDALAASQALYSDCRYDEALALLRRLAANTRQRQQHFSAPVRILSPGEAEHLQFSHLWIMGLEESRWPPALQNNGLIPYPLQCDYGFARPDRSSHYRWYCDLLARIRDNTSQALRMSYARMADDVENEISAAARSLSDTEQQADPDLPDTQLNPVTRDFSAASLETLSEPPYLPLGTDESPRGGTQLIENQAICPFRAFAIHRLDATALEEPVSGLSPLVKGKLLHRALETLWRQLHSHEALIESSTEQLDRRCREAADEALREIRHQHPELLQARFMALEQRRLREVLMDWLEKEKSHEFQAIVDLEFPLTWEHGPLKLSLKLDRVEELTDHSLAIMDYKSGRKATIHWQDERPEHPQLMLYLLAAEKHYHEQDISALLYAYVDNNHSPRIHGRCASPEGYTQLSVDDLKRSETAPDWNELRQQWHNNLEALADEFIEGRHSVSPKRPGTHCARCHLPAFCRVGERQSPGNQAVPGDAEGEEA